MIGQWYGQNVGINSLWPSAWPHQGIIWTYVDLSSKVLCGIHLKAVWQEVLMNLISNLCCGNVYFLMHLYGITYPFLNFNGATVEV